MEHPRQRLRFEDLDRETRPDGCCRISVTLEWCGRTLVARADGLETHHARVRASAEACLEAALQATGKRVHLELIGVKAFRAFDGWVVVVRLIGEAEGRAFRLLGASSTDQEGEVERASALAVLDATNRILERFVGA